jgi:hypothetical protein
MWKVYYEQSNKNISGKYNWTKKHATYTYPDIKITTAERKKKAPYGETSDKIITEISREMEWLYRTEEDLTIKWDTRLLEERSDSSNT